MADIVIDKLVWLRPPNWDEVGGIKRGTLHFSHYWGATEDFSTQVIVNLSNYVGLNGKEIVRSVIHEIEYNGFGVDALLYWDRPYGSSTVTEICHIGGTAVEFQGIKKGPYVDPGNGDGTDRTGDILLTTVGGASADFLDMRINLSFKETVKPGTVISAQDYSLET